MQLCTILYPRLNHTIRQPQGHSLMIVKVAAEGQQIAKLASFVAQIEYFELSVTTTYTIEDWKRDLKKVCTHAGMKDTPIVLFCSDDEINMIEDLKIPFFEDLESLMKNGTVPNLFRGADKELVAKTVDETKLKRGEKVSQEHLFHKFCQVSWVLVTKIDNLKDREEKSSNYRLFEKAKTQANNSRFPVTSHVLYS